MERSAAKIDMEHQLKHFAQCNCVQVKERRQNITTRPKLKFAKQTKSNIQLKLFSLARISISIPKSKVPPEL